MSRFLWFTVYIHATCKRHVEKGLTLSRGQASIYSVLMCVIQTECFKLLMSRPSVQFVRDQGRRSDYES